MGKKGPLWWRESDWLLRGSSAANQILLRHSGPILSAVCPRPLPRKTIYNLENKTICLLTRVTCTPSANKAARSGFGTQRRRHQKSKTGVSMAPQKGLISSKIFLKKDNLSA